MVESDFGLCGTCWRETPFVGGTVCESCGVPLIGAPDGHKLECDDCMQTPRPWRQGRAALLYEGRARRMILALKHGDRGDIARPAARWLLQAARPLLTAETIIAPVPLHRTRLLRRRYNQSALLAQELARLADVECCPDLLIRQKRTPSLEGKTAAERAGILETAIAVHPRRAGFLDGRDVLIVDDVMTTGATLTACALACGAGNVGEVNILTLARVAKSP